MLELLLRLRDGLFGSERGWERHLPPEYEGDFRGAYDYGRPAHRADPNAHYGFENDPKGRALEPDAD